MNSNGQWTALHNYINSRQKIETYKYIPNEQASADSDKKKTSFLHEVKTLKGT